LYRSIPIARSRGTFYETILTHGCDGGGIECQRPRCGEDSDSIFNDDAKVISAHGTGSGKVYSHSVLDRATRR